MLNVDAEKLRTCFINVVANADTGDARRGRAADRISPRAGNLRDDLLRQRRRIDPEVVAHVFEPFFTTKREGIGLGLFLSRAIMEGHGGTITIGPNDPPPGTTVTFTFPLGATGKQP